MDIRLRCRRRVAATSAPADAIHYGERDADERIGGAGEPNDVQSERDGHDGYGRELERERSCGRKCDARHDHICRRVYRTRRPAVACDGAGHGHKPRRLGKIQHRQLSDHERYRAELVAESRKRGTRRNASVPSHRE